MLHAAVAAAIAGLGWLGLIYVGYRLDPGPVFLIPFVGWAMFAPSLAGWLAVGRRSERMLGPSMAAAFIPGALLALFTIGRTELWLAGALFIAALSGVGAAVAWGLATTLHAMADTHAGASEPLGPERTDSHR